MIGFFENFSRDPKIIYYIMFDCHNDLKNIKIVCADILIMILAIIVIEKTGRKFLFLVGQAFSVVYLFFYLINAIFEYM